MNQIQWDCLRSRTLLAIAILVIGLTSASSRAFAEPIVFVHTGIGSGTIDATPFFDAAFTITAIGDTDNRESTFGVFSTDHVTATIVIEGIGSLQFVTETRTFVNNDLSLVGFSRASDSEADLFNGPDHAEFSTWDMLTSVGPHSGEGLLLQWITDDVETTGGVLFFETAAVETATFQATVVPEPATLWTAAIGLAVLLYTVAGERRRGRVT
jgi:hypothetical protein